MFFDFTEPTTDHPLVQIFEYYLGEMQVFGNFSFLDIQFFNLVVDDFLNVELYRSFDWLTDRGCSYRPPTGKPTGSTFHSHAEFPET